MLFEAFRYNRLNHASSPAFLISAGDRSIPISWKQFTDDIDAISYGIRKKCPGAVIGLLGENSYEWIVAHAAVIFSGAVVLPLDVNLSPTEIVSRMEKVGSRILIYSALHSEKALQTQRLMPSLTVSGFGSPEAESFIAQAKAAIGEGSGSLFCAAAPDTSRTSMIVFTSGTSAEPRGVELTIGGMESFAQYTNERLRYRRDSRSLMLLPLQHIFGITVTYAMLAYGVALGVCPDYRRIYDAVVRFRAAFLFLVPALADILASKIEQKSRNAKEPLDFPINWICTGGAPISLRTRKRLEALGIKMLSAYGLTETTAVYSISKLEDYSPEGSAGVVCSLPGFETKVSPDGELMIRGPAVMKGYYQDKERTLEVKDADGWFHTGDKGEIASDGTVWVKGRISRTIVLSSGKKIAPEELESKLMMYPEVKEVLVYGDGESRDVVAEIYSDAKEGDVHSVVQSMNLTLPVYMRVKRVIVRKTPFPRTSSGKIALPRYKGRKRAKSRSPFLVLLGGGVLAILVFVLEVVLSDFVLENEGGSRFARMLLALSESMGDMLLVSMALILIFCAWRMGRRR